MIKKILLLTLLAVGLSSCIEVNLHYVINPNYSGKLIFSSKEPANPFNFGGSEPVNLEEKAQESLQKLFDKHPNIKSWSNIKYEFTDDSSNIKISAVGYFDDFNKLSSDDIFKYKIVKKDGNTYFTFDQYIDSVMKAQKLSNAQKPKPDLTEEQIADSAKALKRKTEQSFMMLSTFMSGMKVTNTYEFAGNIFSKDGKKLSAPNQFTIEFSWDRLRKFSQKMMNNKDYYEDIVRGKSQGFDIDMNPENRDKLVQMTLDIFSDQKENINNIKIDFQKPLFDYKSELKKSLKEWTAWKKEHKKLSDDK